MTAVRDSTARVNFMAKALHTCEQAQYCKEDVDEITLKTFRERVAVFTSEAFVPPKDERILFENQTPKPHRVLLSATGHVFKQHTFKKPTWDSITGEFITGVIHQGYRCSNCRVNISNKPESLALSKFSSCIGQEMMSDDEHRRKGNFEKRRDLLLVWKKTGLQIVNKDVIKIIEGKIGYLQ